MDKRIKLPFIDHNEVFIKPLRSENLSKENRITKLGASFRNLYASMNYQNCETG